MEAIHKSEWTVRGRRILPFGNEATHTDEACISISLIVIQDQRIGYLSSRKNAANETKYRVQGKGPAGVNLP